MHLLTHNDSILQILADVLTPAPKRQYLFVATILGLDMVAWEMISFYLH